MEKEIWQTVAAIITATGGAGFIILCLSNWLGKVWANRIMDAEKAKYQNELETLRASLIRSNDEAISNIRNGLEIYKEKHLKSHIDKLDAYRLSTDIVSTILAMLDHRRSGGLPPPNQLEILFQFNRDRMRAFASLMMFAPQSVLDGLDNLFMEIFDVLSGTKTYRWEDVRKLVYLLANEIRKDIGIETSPIEYRGTR